MLNNIPNNAKIELDLSFLQPHYDKIDLPSMGSPYPESNPFSKGSVRIRPWGSTEEQYVDNFNKGNFYTIIESLLSNAILEKCDITKLTLGDAFYILYWIRSLSYGSKYELETQCPHCNEIVKVSVDISECPIKYLDTNLTEFNFILPSSKIEVKYRLTYLEDMIESTTKNDKTKIGGKSKFSAEINRLIRVVTEMTLPNENKDVLTYTKDLAILKNKIWPLIPAIDIIALKEEMSKYDHGYVDPIFVKCPECKESFEQSPLISYEFFRPSVGKPTENSKLSVDVSQSES